MTATATAPLFPYTVLSLSGNGTVECSLVLAADAVSALAAAQARYDTDAGPAPLDDGEDAAARAFGAGPPATGFLAVYPGHQIGVLGGVFRNPAVLEARTRVGAASA